MRSTLIFAFLAIAHGRTLDVKPADRIWKSYSRFAKGSPLMSNMATAGALAVVSDGIAQGIESHGTKYDGLRTLRFVLFRTMLVVPLYTAWMRVLESLPLPLSTTRFQTALLKTVLDCTIFSPPTHATFFILMAMWEGQSFDEALSRCVVMVPKSLPASWAFWVPAQLMTFGLVPPHLRVAFVNTVSLAWNSVMSALNEYARHDGA